jgi:hypothetical protein
MTLTFIRPAIDGDDIWSVTNLYVQPSHNNTIDISATIRNNKTKKKSSVFMLNYNGDTGHIDVSSVGYQWTTKIGINLDPKNVIKMCLKKPIVVSVMYQVGVSRATQSLQMNKFFGYKLFSDNITD